MSDITFVDNVTPIPASWLNDVNTTNKTLPTPTGAGLIGTTPAGNLASTTVQSALNELDTEKASLEQMTIIDRRTPTTTAVSTSNPMYIGHRGSSLLYPEETNTAYRNSLSDGCQFLESDVRVLTDGALAMMHDTTVDRTTTGTGNVTSFNAATWKALNVDADAVMGLTSIFSNTLHPELLDDHLVTFSDKAVFVIEDNDFNAMTAIVANLIKRGIRRDQVILQCFNYDQLKIATDAGYEGIYLCSNGGYANIAFIKANRINWVGAGISSTPMTDAEIQNWITAGIKVVCWTVNRRSIRDAKLALGVVGFFTDDPAYLKSTTPLYTRDQFSRQMWVPGMIGGASSLGTDASRGVFVAPNKWGYNVTTAGYSGCLQGYLCPLLGKTAPSTYTIDFKLAFTAYSDTTRWASVFISPDDQQFVDGAADGNNGYHFLVRKNGTLDVYRKDKNVASVNIGTITGTAFTDSVDTPCRITVTPTTIKIAVLNGSGVDQQNITVSTTAYRGGYVHLGRSGAACLFSDVIVTNTGP